jgi:hypothetical protein
MKVSIQFNMMLDHIKLIFMVFRGLNVATVLW